MTPEQQARQEIDRQLAAAGWIVQDHKAMNLGAGPGVAVREFPLETGLVVGADSGGDGAGGGGRWTETTREAAGEVIGSRQDIRQRC